MNIFKNRKLIWFSLSDKVEGTELDQVSIIGINNPVKIYLLCNDEIKQKLPPVFSMFLYHYGECYCFVESFNNFKKKLLTDNEFLNLIDKEHHIVFDIPGQFRKILRSATGKKSWPNIIKKLVYFIL